MQSGDAVSELGCDGDRDPALSRNSADLHLNRNCGTGRDSGWHLNIHLDETCHRCRYRACIADHGAFPADSDLHGSNHTRQRFR